MRQSNLGLASSAKPELPGIAPGRVRLSFSTVGFLGQTVTLVGAGEVRSGVGTQPHPGDDEGSVAHSGQVRSGRGTGRRATQGSPPFFPATPPLRDEPASLLVSQNNYP